MRNADSRSVLEITGGGSVVDSCGEEFQDEVLNRVSSQRAEAFTTTSFDPSKTRPSQAHLLKGTRVSGLGWHLCALGCRLSGPCTLHMQRVRSLAKPPASQLQAAETSSRSSRSTSRSASAADKVVFVVYNRLLQNMHACLST